MNYGLYTAASGALTNIARQDVYANNLANVTTAAFKPQVFSIRSRGTVVQEDGLSLMDSNAMLERLGGGVMPMPTTFNLTPAALETTGQPFDLGIEGDGFFGVEGRDGSVLLSRDGRLTLNSSGLLVRSSDGAPVLSASDSPIRLNPTIPVTIDALGVVRQNNAEVAKLGFWQPADPDALVPMGAGLFGAGDDDSLRDATGRIRQGTIEASGVNAIDALMDVTSAGQAVESNIRMIGIFDTTMDRAINQLGRVT